MNIKKLATFGLVFAPIFLNVTSAHAQSNSIPSSSMARPPSNDYIYSTRPPKIEDFDGINFTPAFRQANLISLNNVPLIDHLGNWVGPKAGLQGAAGAAGVAGPAGAQGLKGDAGSAGAAGPAGPQGAAGAIGAAGAAGPAGPQGATGLPGPAGMAGPAGPAGAQGAQGLKGDAGTPGVDGSAGPAGPQGFVGMAGPAGPAGAQGAQGLKGDAGAAGPIGAQGMAGPAGPQGPSCFGGTCSGSTTFSGSNTFSGTQTFKNGFAGIDISAGYIVTNAIAAPTILSDSLVVIQGAFAQKPTMITTPSANYSMTMHESFVLVKNGGFSDVSTITLPNAGGSNFNITIKNSGYGTVKVVPAAPNQVIDGSMSVYSLAGLLNAQGQMDVGESVTLISDGNWWSVVSRVKH